MSAMRFLTTVFCFCGLLARFTIAQGEIGSECLTPNNYSGVCVDLRDCNDLLRMLQSRSNEPGVKEFLRSSTCGFVGFNPLVCCRRERPTVPPVNFPTSATSPTSPTRPTSLTIPTRSPIASSTSTNAPTTVSRPTSSSTTTTISSTTTEAVSPTLSGIPTAHPLAGARYSLPRFPNCGITELSSNEKVVGGRPARLGEFPWIVALGYRNAKNPNQPKWLCGGSLITEKHVLTAAHCAGRDDLYLIRAGDLDLYDNADGAIPIDVPIEKVKIHEDYSRSPIVNDIAIITLRQPAKGYLIKSVCLPLDEPLKSKNLYRYEPLVSGWGAIHFNGPSSASLQTVMLPVVSEDQCKRAYANFSNAVVDNRVLCAGYLEGKKDSCQGDSGGPLILAQNRVNADNNVFYQIGVVSYGFRCAVAGFPGIYTRVTTFLEWIERNLD